MKIKHLFPLFIGAAIWLASCGEGGEAGPTDRPNGQEGETQVEKGPEGIPFDPDAIYLERMYATSTGDHSAANLLDGDAATYWNAMTGAGKDEGIMLYFEAPTFVQKVAFRGAGGGSSLEELGLYVNGSEVGTTTPDGEIAVESEVQSLFVRVTAVAGAKTDSYVDEDEIMEQHVVQFPENLDTRLAEIELYGRDGKPLKVRPLHLEPGSISSTSVLTPPEAYQADFLFDSRLEFGWAEGKDDEGIGESITFDFDKEVKITRLKVWNGYQRSDDHFEKNARVKDFTFGLAEGMEKAYQLGDTQTPNMIGLDEPLEGKSFRLTINSVYPGSKYKDLLLSELRFFDGQQWFGIESGGEKARKAALKEKVAGTPIENLLDRSLGYTEMDHINDSEYTIGLILRSNGSYVLYKDFRGSKDNTIKKLREVADGNWEIQKANASMVRVKIFGKLHRIMDKDLVYKAKSKRLGKRIYSEILTIYPDYIEGQNMIQTMRLKVLK